MHLSMKYKSSPFFLLFQLKSIYFWVSRKNLKETAHFIVRHQCSEIEIDCKKCISNIMRYSVCFVFVEKKNISKFQVFSNCNEMILSVFAFDLNISCDLNADTALRNGNFTTSILPNRQLQIYMSARLPFFRQDVSGNIIYLPWDNIVPQLKSDLQSK